MYIVCKNIKLKGIAGYFDLKTNQSIECKNNLLYYDGKAICYTTSQNAYDYFVNNFDGKGKERYALINNIKELYSNIIKRDNERYMKLLAEDENAEYVSTLPFIINFNYEFYNNDINKLKEMEAQLNG